MKKHKTSNYKKSTTHLFLNGKKLKCINDPICENDSQIEVVYLQCNLLNSIHNLNTLTHLTHLYLQWNRITTIRNLNNMPNLSKLYLGYNRISTIDGLTNMPNLRVLHVEKQNLPSMEGLQFDEKTMNSLAVTLMELNLYKNYIFSLSRLVILKNLTWLDVSHNLLNNKVELLNALRVWNKLKMLRIAGNPVLKEIKNIAVIISSSSNLELLDNRRFSTETCSFLRNLATIKKLRESIKSKELKLPLSTENRNYNQQAKDLKEIVPQSMKLNKRQ